MKTLAKAALYLSIYALLHFAYETTEYPFLKPISGIDESVFEHLKIGFYAYFFASVVEYLLIRKKQSLALNFWTSRIFASTFVPWCIVIIWYLAPALIGKLGLQAELAWALMVTFLSGVIAKQLEKTLEEKKQTMAFRFSVFALFIVALIFFTAFTYEKPWIDLFVDPLTLGRH